MQISNEIYRFKNKNEYFLATSLLIVLIFNVLILAFLFPKLTGVNDNLISKTQTQNDGQNRITTPETPQKVKNALFEFSGGFQAQGNTGDQAIQYYIQNSKTIIGFGQNDVKIIFENTYGKENIEPTEITLTFSGSHQSKPIASSPIASKTLNYIGTNISNVKQQYLIITYKNLYPNIDLEYTIKNGELKYNFLVYPGGNPNIIQMQWTGPVKLTQLQYGMQLIVRAVHGNNIILDQNPTSLQPSVSDNVKSALNLINNNTYGFKVTNYDPNKLLIIDPAYMIYSMYVGGYNEDDGNSIAVDSYGNSYITGMTYSNDFPTTLTTTYMGNYDIFVSKFAPNQTLIYSTFLGGSGDDLGLKIVVDLAGNAYITGYTDSSDFPHLNAFQPSITGTGYDAFYVKLSSNGSLLISTYLGGSNNDYGASLAVDSTGNVVIVGETTSLDFPTLNAFNASYNGGTSDAFITKISSTGSLVFSTYLGGSSQDVAYDVAVYNYGGIYVTGYTNSVNFPTLNALNNSIYYYSSFITELTSSGTIYYSTYFGGEGSYGVGIAVDYSGNVYVTGQTTVSNFPTQYAYNATYGGLNDVYLAKFGIDNSLIYSTYLGGSGDDFVNGISIDPYNNVFIVGKTNSINFPTSNTIYSTYRGGPYDGFVSFFSSDGGLKWSSLLGGSSDDSINGVAVDNNGSFYLVGTSDSVDFPTSLMQGTNQFSNPFGGYDVILSKFVNPDSSAVSITSVFVSTSSKSIKITWNAPTYTDYFLYYEIDRSTNLTSGYSYLTDVTTPRYVDSSITPGITYFYIINSFYYFGEGIPNTPVIGVIKVIPSAPLVTAKAGNQSVYLSWTTPTSDGGSTILEYQVFRGTQPGQHLLIGLTNNNYFNDTDLNGGTKYYYVVAAINSVGKGNYSNEIVSIPLGSSSLVSIAQYQTVYINITTTVTSESKSSSSTPGFEIIPALMLFLVISVVFISKRRNNL